MTSLLIHGPVDLERLSETCREISASVALASHGDALELRLVGEDAAGCAELLRESLEIDGVLVDN